MESMLLDIPVFPLSIIIFFFKRNKLKFERILRSANRPEVLLKEMTVIDFY
jgi:hypothetical protein